MQISSDVILIGEDLLDPYGGAFKVTKGLSTEFPGRVLATPISESAIIGAATGMAMRGFLPVAEIMFGDFITLCTDQIVNSATKFPLMYGVSVNVPVVIRTPMGGGRGYGPTHSQSLEKMFLGVPGLKVVSPSLAHDPGAILEHCILREKEPTLFVEYKELYPQLLLDSSTGFNIRHMGANPGYPLAIVDNFGGSDKPDIVVIAYGGASNSVLRVAQEMMQEEIRVRAIFPVWLNDPTVADILLCLTGREQLIIAECGTSGFDWGGELSARLYEALFGRLAHPIRRLASAVDVIPAAKHLEEKKLLSQQSLRETIFECLS